MLILILYTRALMCYKSILNPVTASKTKWKVFKVQVNSFSLTDYSNNNILLNSDDLLKKFVTISNNQLSNTVKSHEETVSYIFLIDFTIRAIEELTESYESYPFWEKFISKLSYSEQKLTLDKFMHIHDIGQYQVCNV